MVLEIDKDAVVTPLYTPALLRSDHELPLLVDTCHWYVGLEALLVAVMVLAAPPQTAVGELIAAVGLLLIVTVMPDEELPWQPLALVA